MTDRYPIYVAPLSDEDGGGWIALVHDLPGCMGDGETPEEAIADARKAIEVWLGDSEAPAPAPSSCDPMTFIKSTLKAA